MPVAPESCPKRPSQSVVSQPALNVSVFGDIILVVKINEIISGHPPKNAEDKQAQKRTDQNALRLAVTFHVGRQISRNFPLRSTANGKPSCGSGCNVFENPREFISAIGPGCPRCWIRVFATPLALQFLRAP